MKHLKTYEGLFGKQKDKPNITGNEMSVLISDCLYPLKDNGLMVDVIMANTVSINIHMPKKSDSIVFNFKDIKHEVLQLCNMLGDYGNVGEISFQIEFVHQWDSNLSNYEPTYKKILKGLYDKVPVISFGIKIK
jgi:hypothetical protein